MSNTLEQVYQDFAMSKYANPAERVAALAREVARLRDALNPPSEVPPFDATQRCAWLPGGRPQDDCPRCHFTHGCDRGTAGVGGNDAT